MWITPKTNWGPNDYFNLDPDYGRIKGNILEVEILVKLLYGNPFLRQMAEYDIAGYGDASFYNNIEDNVWLLAEACLMSHLIQRYKTWVENRAIWKYDDLNRIEEGLLFLYEKTTVQKECRMTLDFTLGGGMYYVEPI